VPKVEYIAEGVTLYLGDARDLLPSLGRFDALVTDPPYGIGEAAGKAKTRTSGFTSKLKNAQNYRRDYGDDDWDNEPIPADLLDAARSAARVNVIFGGNYYDLPPSSCWLVWDKLNGDTDFADCELAWTNMEKAVRRIQYLWNGALRQNKEIRGDHPTQKPVGVMRWAIGLIPPPAQTILDPFMGSGTTGVAAAEMGRHFSGIERKQPYFDAACRRVAKAVAEYKPDMFIEKPKPAKQEALL
jgi:DNA modification methylase